jgi:signal peptidase
MRSRSHLRLVRPPRRIRVAFARANKAALAALTVLAFLFWAQYLRPQTLGGNAGYVLVSGKSMEPHYHTGDLVLVLRQPSYHVGDIVAYRVPQGDAMAGAQVIHRIIGGDGAHGFVVQGDNRTAPDVWRPKTSDVVGAKVLRVPNAVVLLQYLRSPFLLALLAATFAFVHVIARDSKSDETRHEDESAPLREAA